MEKHEKDMSKMHEKRTKTEQKTKELRTLLIDLRAECQKEEEKGKN